MPTNSEYTRWYVLTEQWKWSCTIRTFWTIGVCDGLTDRPTMELRLGNSNFKLNQDKLESTSLYPYDRFPTKMSRAEE